MECERFNERLSEYVDGMLGVSEIKTLRQHLSECRRCREDAEEIQRMKLILRAMKGPVAPDGFWPRMYSRLRVQQTILSRRFRWREWLGGKRRNLAVAITAVVAILVAFFPSIRQNPGEWELHPDDLISLHASSTLRAPLSDHGRIGFVLSESDARSLDDAGSEVYEN